MNAFYDPNMPVAAEIEENTQESSTIFTLHLRLQDQCYREQYAFAPGQFNMVYLYGVGEVAISIVSDPEDKDRLSHTIRAVGRVTKALQKLKRGDQIGIRGPYGYGWPLLKAINKDVIIVTGGLGCAPVVALINYIMNRRDQYGAIKILQGVKHSEDFIFRKQYAIWQAARDTEIFIAADQAGPHWPWGVGYVTDMIKPLKLNTENTVAMMCGPEMMISTAIKVLTQKAIKEDNIYISMERNMECGIGLCGHCQYGGLFICKDGPVFAYPRVKALFDKAGF